MRPLPYQEPLPFAPGCLFAALLLTLPIFGYRYLGLGGLLGGLAVMNLVQVWFSLTHRPHGSHCAVCYQPVLQQRQPTYSAGLPGVFLDRADLMAGRASPGSVCLRCGRIYCGCSYPRRLCLCGSHELRTIAVAYPRA
jgi:hypothetical protein